MKPAKLYRHLVANPATIIGFRELQALFAAFGFECRPGKGDHLNFKHPCVPVVLTVQPRGKDAVPYQVKRLLAVVQEYDLHMSE